MRNQTVLDGYLLKDPEVKTVGDKGTTLTELCVVCTNGKDPYENTVFMNCTAWGKTGEMVAKFFSKGSAIGVTGELKQENWEDKETGKKRNKIVLNINRVDFPIGKGGKGGKAQDQSSTDNKPMGEDEIPF